jgi:hypothetical protein
MHQQKVTCKTIEDLKQLKNSKQPTTAILYIDEVFPEKYLYDHIMYNSVHCLSNVDEFVNNRANRLTHYEFTRPNSEMLGIHIRLDDLFIVKQLIKLLKENTIIDYLSIDIMSTWMHDSTYEELQFYDIEQYDHKAHYKNLYKLLNILETITLKTLIIETDDYIVNIDPILNNNNINFLHLIGTSFKYTEEFANENSSLVEHTVIEEEEIIFDEDISWDDEDVQEQVEKVKWTSPLAAIIAHNIDHRRYFSTKSARNTYE